MPFLGTTRRGSRASLPFSLQRIAPEPRERKGPSVVVALHDLLGMAKFNQTQFGGFVESIGRAVREKTKAPQAQHGMRAEFLKHQVRELAEQQFAPHRAVGELVSNAIDEVRANPDSKGVVDIQIRNGNISVSDDGRGMPLDTIVRTLSVPFQSDKPAEGIGRFGVGFFSNLSFLKDQKATRVSVLTRTADGPAHHAVYERTGDKGQTEYELGIGEALKIGAGTTVHIEGIKDKQLLGVIKKELADMFQHVPDVQVRLNGKAINRHKKSRTERTYELSVNGKPVRVSVDYNVKNGETRLTQGGVRIHTMESSAPGRIVIDLPLDFPVGEGRRGFQMNSEYVNALAQAFGPVQHYVGMMRRRLPRLGPWRDRFDRFVRQRVLATHNHTDNVVHPFDAFSRTATAEQLVELHNLNKPRAFLESKPVVNAPSDQNKADLFLGRDANVVNRTGFLPGYHFQFNPHVMTAEEFLRGRTVETRPLNDAERRKLGIKETFTTEVHFVRLAGNNATPLLHLKTGPLQNKPTYYVNVDHPIYRQDTQTSRAILQNYGWRFFT